jgi:hypothetical protein
VDVNADDGARAWDQRDLGVVRDEGVEGVGAVLEDGAVAPEADYLWWALVCMKWFG